MLDGKIPKVNFVKNEYYFAILFMILLHIRFIDVMVTGMGMEL